MSQFTLEEKEEFDHCLEEARHDMDSRPEEAVRLAEYVVSRTRGSGETDLLGKGLVYLSRAIANTRGITRAIDVADQAVAVLAGSDDLNLRAMGYNNLGNCYRRSRNLGDATDSYCHSLELYRIMGNTRGEALVLNGMAQTYKMMGLFEKAYDTFTKSRSLAAEEGLDLIRAITLGNLADMFLEQRDLETAEKYLKEGLELNTALNRRLGIGFCLGNLGRLEMYKNNLDRAEEYLRQAVDVWREVGCHYHIVTVLCNLADLMEKKNSMQEAEELLKEAVLAAKETQTDEQFCIAQSRLASFNQRTGRGEGQEKELLRIIDHLEDIGDQGLEKLHIFETLSSFYEQKGNYKEALKYQRQAYSLNNHRMFYERAHDVVRMQMKNEFQRSEEQRLKLQKKRKALRKANEDLRDALASIRTLKELLPICARCKKIRNDNGYWEQIEGYISQHSDTRFSHSLCPECRRELYPELEDSDLDEGID